jgi:hypothetical protein
MVQNVVGVGEKMNVVLLLSRLEETESRSEMVEPFCFILFAQQHFQILPNSNGTVKSSKFQSLDVRFWRI